MILVQYDVGSFFNELLADLECQNDTRAYIVSTFDKYKVADQNDLSQFSVGELFCRARQKNEFAIYQNVGDWIFVCSVMFPQHLKHASKDYYDNIARLSYYSCYTIIRRQWLLFQELADNFPLITETISRTFYNYRSSRELLIA